LHHCGEPLYGWQWAYTLRIKDFTLDVERFEVGINVCGDPLAFWIDPPFLCELRKMLPGHVNLLFDLHTDSYRSFALDGVTAGTDVGAFTLSGSVAVFGAKAAFFDFTDALYNFPAITDSPVGSLSLWIYTGRSLLDAVFIGSSPYSYDEPDGDIFSFNEAYLFTGAGEADLFFISVGETKPGISFFIASITNATQAVVTCTVSVSHINVGETVQLNVSGTQLDWNAVAGGHSYTVIAVSGTDVTINLDSSGLSAFNPSLNPTKLLQSLYNQTVTNITSANPAVVTFAGGHAIPAGAVVFSFFINQTGWETFEAKSMTVLSVTSTTMTLDFDSTGFPAYNPALFGNSLALFQVYNSPSFYLSNTIDPHNEDFLNEHIQPIPSNQWVNMLVSWDTNHPEFNKKFQLYYGDTFIPTTPFANDVSVAFSVPWSQPSVYNDRTQSPWIFSSTYINSLENCGGVLAYIAEVPSGVWLELKVA
jgi:hypothetical protein